MDTAKIFCDDCDKWYTVEFMWASDLPEMTCPKCNGNNLWFGEIIQEEEITDDSITLGRGGRGAPG